LHDPPALLVGASTLNVALDSTQKLELGDGLQATTDARFDVPYLRFGDVRITLEMEGQGAVLLEPEGARAKRSRSVHAR